MRAVGGGIEVRLKAGETITANMVAVAARVRPNLSCVGNGVCRIKRGSVVNEYLETSAAGVYAAGDVAEAQDFLSDDRTIQAVPRA